jgi:phage terminase small subunit
VVDSPQTPKHDPLQGFKENFPHGQKPKRAKRPRKSAAIRYKLFVHAYVKDLNGTRAAIAAGYAPKNAAVTASQLLNLPKIKKLLAALVAEKTRKFDISADNVLAHIAKLAKANMMDFMVVGKDGQPDTDFSNLTREQAYAIQEICVDTTGGTGDGERRQVLRTRFKLAGKEKPLEMLARYLKLLTDRVEVNGLEGLVDALQARRKQVGA